MIVRPTMAAPGILIESDGRWVIDGHGVYAQVVGSPAWIPTHSPDDPQRVELTLTVHGERDWTMRYSVRLDHGPLARCALAYLPHGAEPEGNSCRLRRHDLERPDPGPDPDPDGEVDQSVLPGMLSL